MNRYASATTSGNAGCPTSIVPGPFRNRLAAFSLATFCPALSAIPTIDVGLFGVILRLLGGEGSQARHREPKELQDLELPEEGRHKDDGPFL